MTDETFNGWKNYPTWAVNLWLSNDAGLYERALEIAEEEYRDAQDCLQYKTGIWTHGEALRFNLADHLQEWVCEEVASYDEADLLHDLIDYALDMVDWEELAAHWLGHRAEIESVRA